VPPPLEALESTIPGWCWGAAKVKSCKLDHTDTSNKPVQADRVRTQPAPRFGLAKTSTQVSWHATPRRSWNGRNFMHIMCGGTFWGKGVSFSLPSHIFCINYHPRLEGQGNKQDNATVVQHH